MQLFCESDNYKLFLGSMLDMEDAVQRESIDSIVTDPPYELNFMGKGWDNSGVTFQKETWQRCFDVLKPGGYLLAFGGSRTFHRIACAIEDAGFEIRDTIMWLYGSGFPKSMDIEKAINKKDGVDFVEKDASGVGFMSTNDDGYHNTIHQLVQIGESTERAKLWKGWGTALKPAYEPVIVARKPCEGSCVDNVLEYGVGGINIDECRIKHNEEVKTTNRQPKSGAVFNTESSGYDNTENHMASADPNGRFPANVILTYGGTDEQEVCGGMPDTKSTGGSGEASKVNTFSNIYNGGWGHEQGCAHLGGLGDEGSAARYFYCAKASKRDRDEGLEGFETQTKVFNGKSDKSSTDIKDVEQRFTTQGKNIHPTVKPTALMQYLVRLVTPKGGTVLDPFNGSGSTGKATMYENNDRNAGYKYIGIDLSDEYLNISRARIDYAIGDTSELVYNEIPSAVKKPVPKSDFVSLFV